MDSAQSLAASEAHSMSLALAGMLNMIGRARLEAKKRVRPLCSTASTAPQRGHLYFPCEGTSSVTRQRAQGVCMGNETGGGDMTGGGVAATVMAFWPAAGVADEGGRDVLTATD